MSKDQVLYWNAVALKANEVSFTDPTKSEQGGPTLSSRALAIVHLAIHDAYVGISGTRSFDAYLGTNLPAPPAPGVRSVDAAIAGAAHTALCALYTQQKPFFDANLNAITHILSGRDESHKYGCMVAHAILADRAGDPGNSNAGYTPHSGRHQHKPDPDNRQGFLAPFYGAKSKLFSASARHTLVAPPSQDNDPIEYQRIVAETRRLGIAPNLMGTLPNDGTERRTPEQTLIGIYWGYDGANGIGTPPKLYNQIVRTVAINRNNTVEQNVRLFALVNTAMADAGILAWDQKYIHNFWRPVVGIREHDQSMGSTGVGNNNLNPDCDPNWLPLGAPKSNVEGSKNFTPDFPAYPSGHATFGAAALHTTRLFYNNALMGDRNPDNLFDGCDFVSDEFNGVTKDNEGAIRPCHVRNFPDGLWQMIVENGLSRVYLGVHWSFDAFKTDPSTNQPVFDQQTGGVDLGVTIAEDIFSNGLTKSTEGPRV